MTRLGAFPPAGVAEEFTRIWRALATDDREETGARPLPLREQAAPVGSIAPGGAADPLMAASLTVASVGAELEARAEARG